MTKQKSLFVRKLEKLWAKDKFLCIGLDSDYNKLPKSIKGKPQDRIFKFNKAIVDKTHDLVNSYKLNCAFYEARGIDGIAALLQTVKYVKKKHPQIPVILDAKRGDIGNTNQGYVEFAFDYLGADAITIHPYLGQEAIQPFLDQKDKGIIVLVRTSNPGAGQFQDLKVSNKVPLYLTIAKKVAKDWNKNENCCLVVGATYPKELAQIRKAVGDIPFLIPGIGAQGGDVRQTVKAAKTKNGGMIIHSSRAIIFASDGPDFDEAARKKAIETNNLINEARKNIMRFREK